MCNATNVYRIRKAKTNERRICICLQAKPPKCKRYAQDNAYMYGKHAVNTK